MNGQGELIVNASYKDFFIDPKSMRRDAFIFPKMAELKSMENTTLAGSVLINDAIKMAKEKGELAIILLGHKDYYPKFGFSTSAVSGVQSSFNKESFMGLELKPGSLK